MSTFLIPEIHCDACIRSLTGAVRDLDAQATLLADLQTKQVTVATTASDAAVVAAFEDAGFSVEPA
jgi:copper chaperone CopZ